MMNKIIIAEDHPLFSAALKVAVSKYLDNPKVYEAGSVAALQAILEEEPSPHLILLDLQMPGAHGLSALIFLRGQFSHVPVLIVSASEDSDIIQQAAKHGAAGYVSKAAPMVELTGAIHTILSGGTCFPEQVMPCEPSASASDIEQRVASLTPQQFRVLGMVSEGLLNKQIAFDLEISEATVKAHLTAIFKKLNVNNRTQAVIALNELEVEGASGNLPSDQSNL